MARFPQMTTCRCLLKEDPNCSVDVGIARTFPKIEIVKCFIVIIQPVVLIKGSSMVCGNFSGEITVGFRDQRVRSGSYPRLEIFLKSLA